MSDLLQRIDRLYELDAEPLMFSVGASVLLIECRTKIESLQRENEAFKKIARSDQGTIESLEQENEKLKEKLKAAEYDWNEDPNNLTPPLPEGKTIAVLSTAITPEMREKLNECIAGYRISGTDGNRKYWAVELISAVRDLLGEQDD